MQQVYATSWRRAVPSPRGFVKRARRVVRDITLSAASVLHRRRDTCFLRNLYCHYVFDDQLEAFERIIVRLKQDATFVDADTCLDMVTGKKPIDGRYFHLSFDDGFRNVYTNAVPILQKHGVTAMFYVPSSLVEGDLATTRKFCMETTSYRQPIEMVQWSELRHMVELGFQIGSHTRTHTRFSAMSHDPVRLRDEIAGSKREIEDQLGRPCPYISWPYGKRRDADPVSLEMTRQAGYSACFGAYRGRIVPGATDVFSVPRHHFEVEWPLSHITYFAEGNREEPQ
jgi:peptidoglycan/xylan/chitin deacetylase (PgdA/CDA1 family)